MNIKPTNLIPYFFISIIILLFSCNFIHADLTVNGTNDFYKQLNFSPARSTQPLIVLSQQWGKLGATLDSSLASLTTSFVDTVEAAIGDPPLVFPNPFKLNEGAELGYSLTRSDMDIELRIYDMKGYEIKRKVFEHGTQGAFINYNKVKINKDFFGHSSIPAGIYFYVILHENNLLGKGKFAVAP